MDFRLRTASSFHIRHFLNVSAIHASGNNIFIGGTECHGNYLYQQSQKVLALDVRMAKPLALYHLPCQWELSTDTRVRQIWVSRNTILAMNNASKIYTFDNIHGGGSSRLPNMYGRGAGLRYVIGPFRANGKPNFDVAEHKVVIAGNAEAPMLADFL